jgi:nucleotide-binding universal stress UspA family protein
VRRVLVAVSGVLLSEFLERTLGQLDWGGAELYLLHIVDTRPLREYGLAAGALPARTEQAATRVRRMGALGVEAGRRILEEAAALAASRLPAGAPVQRLQRTGVPDQEIIAAAYEIGANLIVLGAAEEPAPPPPPPPHADAGAPGPVPATGQGPGSSPAPPRPPRRAVAAEPPRPSGPPRFPHRHLSPVVRFVIDHAPCDVLLLYARSGSPGG